MSLPDFEDEEWNRAREEAETAAGATLSHLVAVTGGHPIRLRVTLEDGSIYTVILGWQRFEKGKLS